MKAEYDTEKNKMSNEPDVSRLHEELESILEDANKQHAQEEMHPVRQDSECGHASVHISQLHQPTKAGHAVSSNLRTGDPPI